MVIKNNTFVRLPVSEAAKSSWNNFVVERQDAAWRNVDASFKGVLTSGSDKTYCHRPGRRVTPFKSARAGGKHDRASLSPEFQKDETKFR